MPIYDYKCSICDHVEYDVLQKFSDAPPTCYHNHEDSVIGMSRGKKMTVMIAKGGTFSLRGRGWSKDGYSK